MPAPTIKQLEAFVMVAALKIFRRAAEKLNTTQPNISTRIAGLETLIGKSLFNRNTGAFHLTPDGETLLSHARDVLGAMEGFMAAAGESQLIEGVLRLGVSEMVVHTWLSPYLKRLKAHFPYLQVDLQVDLSTKLSAQLFDRNLDLTLQSGPFERKTAGRLPLGATPMVWVAAPELNLAGTPLDLASLSGLPVLTHAKGTLAFDQITAHLADIRATSVRLTPSSNLAACLQMTIEGLGIACLPNAMVTADIAEGRLELLSARWTPDELSFAARYFDDTATSYVASAAKIAQQVAAEHP
ncbi:MAG: LysR family transcriptional regulator [Alphaproteobacteria bacterium]|nr:LysR family transcriptional regulator [Alphaproteobacteria bacterium]